jgi:deoxycytidylate deaminase
MSDYLEIRKVVHLKEIEYIIEAVEISKKSNMKSKHGCIIVKNGKIISKGYNRYIGYNWTHHSEIQGKGLGKYSIHAEEDALKKVDPCKLEGARMYVIRCGLNLDNPIFLDSRPCSKCMKKIKKSIDKYGLKNIYYSLDMNISLNKILTIGEEKQFS